MRQHIATSDVIERDVRTRCNVEFAFKRCGLTQAQANRHGVNEKPEKPGEYQWEALSDQAAREIIAQNTTPYWRQDAFKQIEAKEHTAAEWIRGELTELAAHWDGGAG